MSSAEDITNQANQPSVASPDVDIKSRQMMRSSKEKKKRKTRSRVIKDEEDNPSVDPDYSPRQELVDEGGGEMSSCSIPFNENLSALTAPAIIYPNSEKICALCYCGGKSLLGQGELTRYEPTPGFNPFRKPTLKRGGRDSLSGQSPAPEQGEKSSKSPSRSRSRETRTSRDSSSRPAEAKMVYELSNIGCAEIADPNNVFESSGHVTAHHCCAAWSEGVTQNELYQLLHVDKAVHQGMSLKCSYCGRYGATIRCKAAKCDRIYHYPCAAGSGCFQDIKAMLMLCPSHLEQAPSVGAPEELNCAVCDDIGEISDFLFCTSCGHHYHGNCLHVEVNPVVRAGWQCPDCKICQTCGLPGDDNRMLVCDSCDKGYHTYCLKPAIPCIPNNGWCCQNCRRCVECGMKAKYGFASVWNFSEEVCDKCFQRQDQGHSCPVCGKVYPEQLRNMDMMQCNGCKKWVHEDCDDTVDLDAYNGMEAEYTCPKCRHEATEMDTDPTPPKPTAPEESEPPECMEVDKPPAKRTSISSSIESDKSGSGMKGSSTDPMLFAPQSSLTGNVDDKQRHVSDETIGIVSQQARNLIERKTSSDAHLGSLFSEHQDPLSLFTNDAFQPIVSVPMLPDDDDQTRLGGEDVVKGKTLKDPVREAAVKPEKDSPSRAPGTISIPVDALFAAGSGIGKPGSIYGKGKPFGNKRKPPTSRGSKGKGGSKEKSRGHRRSRQGSNAASGQSTTTSSPINPLAFGSPSSGPTTTSMSIRRRSRSRLSRQDSTLGGGSDAIHEIVDEEFGDSMHNTVVLCSADDTFTLNQDMCVVCGSFGQGKEGRLVACSQCGQCYHPYCVNLKLTRVVLRKGWRCLDCTVCEECGAADDPSHLLLCDDCDISYHTYCLKPPLQHVPKGGWKCKWCVRCTHCSSTSPGFNCDWAENYSSCGPCASLAHCPICRRSYRDEEIIMQCSSCERWLHSACEYLYTESDIEKVLEKGYTCVFCRPKGSTPPHLNLNPPNAFEGDPSSGIYLGRTRSDVEQVKEYHKDGVALTSAGLQHIQQLMQSAMGLNKKKPNVQKRKSHTLQKQSDKVPPQLDVKTEPGSEASLQVTEANIKDDGKDNESTDLPPGGVVDPALNVDTGGDTSMGTDSGSQATPLDSSDPLLSPLEGADPLASPSATDLTKQALSGVQDSAIKRRRKPYRPGIGGFMVRQRNRGGVVGPKVKRNRLFKAVPSLPTANFSSTTGFDSSPSKVDEVKLRASEIAGECESSYIKHETEGGITIAHPKTQDGEVKEEEGSESKCEAEPTSALVPPLKLKISALPPSQPKPKRKRRVRLIDQFPSYIQEGFFGNHILAQAKTTTPDKFDLEETAKTEKKPSSGHDSRIVLPERVKLRLDTQVAVKAAEAKKNAELKEKLASRSAAANDDESLMMDKVSEELLGVLPDDLPFKEDEILGMLSGTQGNEGGNSHENILSPSALETLVTDGLASIDGDVTSLFTDVLNNAQDGDADEQNLLRDIGDLDDVPKSSNSVDLLESSLPVPTHATSTAGFDIESTNAIIDQISQDMLPPDTTSIKQEQQPGMMQQQKQPPMQLPQHMQVQQHQQMQLQQQQQMQQVPPSSFNMQPQMQQNVSMVNKHMFGGDLNPSDPNFINAQQQQHPHFQVPLQQGPIQATPMQVEQSPIPMQPQKFAPRHAQGGPGMSQNVPMSLTPPGHESLRHHPAVMQRQHSMDANAGHMDIQPPPQKILTPSGPVMYRAHHPQGLQKQQTPSHSHSLGQIPPSPSLITKIDPNSVPPDQTGQVSVQSLPDLTREPNLFEPAATPWPLCTDLDGDTLSVNQRNILKWEKDEPLGQYATISPVLYANLKHPYLKKEHPDWQTRAKQVAKLWRKATPEERAPFLQKARDNRAYLKSTRRDLVDLPDQDEHDEEAANIFHSCYSAPQGPVAAPHGPGMEVGRQVSSLQQPQHSPGHDGRGKMGVVSGSPDYNTFIKPKPPSRDPTPKPQSPGASPSSGPGGCSKSPFSAKSPSQVQAPTRVSQQGFPIQRQWSDTSMQGQPMQTAMSGQQTWSPQHQTSMSQHVTRVPKIENIDTAQLSSPTMRFPQAYPTTLAQNPVHPGTPSLTGHTKPAPLQRQDSTHDSPVATNQEQFILRAMTPRPGMPPQLLPQSAGHMQMGQHAPVPAHPNLRSPVPKPSQSAHPPNPPPSRH